MHDVSKLPKWAQYKIELLERNLEYAQKKLLAGPEDSDTFADPYYGGNDDKGRPLGKGTLVRFWLGPKFYQYIDVRIDGRSVQVQGGEGISVQPRSGNLIYVQMPDR